MKLSVKLCLSMSLLVLAALAAPGQSPVKRLPTETVPELLEHLKDKQTRYPAIEKLVQLNARETGSEIAKYLADEDFNVRFAALRALVSLNARGHSLSIWNLYASEQDSQIKSYAYAALVFFEDDKAIGSLERLLNDDIVGGMEILTFIGNVSARAAVPALISILEKDKVSDNFTTNIVARRAVVNTLGSLKAAEAIPILRKYARYKTHFPRWEAIRVLGEFEAKEAVDDLMFVLEDALAKFDGEFQSDSYHTVNNASLALAKIGDRRAWNLLLKTAAHPKFTYASEVIGELNRHLDRALWERAGKQMVSEQMIFKSIKLITDSINRDKGVALVLEFEPGRDFARRTPLENSDDYPWSSAGTNSTVLEVVRILPLAISEGTQPANFTFVFDDGKIRILSVEKAIQVWKTKFLNK